MMHEIEQSAAHNYSMGDYTLAWEQCRAVLAADPEHPDCNVIMGVMCNKAGRHADAERHLRASMSARQPTFVLLTELASSLIALGRLSEAQDLLHRSAEMDCRYEKTFVQQARLFKLSQDTQAAEAVLRHLLKVHPQSVAGLNNLANLLAERNRRDEALRLLEQAAAIDPSRGTSFKSIGMLHFKSGHFKQALPVLLQANKRLPVDTEVLFALGKILHADKKLQKAIEVYQRILAIEPANGEAMMLAGINHGLLRNYELAAGYFDTVYKTHPHYTEAFYRLLRCKADMADWTDREQLQTALIDTITADLQKTQPLACSPMDLHYYNLPDALQNRVMHRFCQQQSIPMERTFALSNRKHSKIRIGYLSPDLRKHPLGMSVYKMFGYHNRQEFEVYVFSQHIPDPTDPFHLEISKTADRFYDISTLDEQASAQLIYDNEIDILIDFGGYSTYTKAGILSMKPAPVIVHMFGQPDTTAMPQVDYFISDRNLIDSVNRPFYTEKILYLPHGFICSPIDPSEQALTRADFGIDETAFVFCSFCSPYKYEPQMFALWMQLLKQVKNSVLWLMTNKNKSFEQNIVTHAVQHGIGSEQILFAQPMPIAEHLQRMKLADLFLDTLYYSSCSTASHALMAGLPVLTLRGNTNASRQGATVCRASGLTQTICHTMDEYYQKARELATNSQKRNALKAQLSRREQLPHFDIAINTGYIEQAYRIIWHRHQKGKPPVDTEI